MSKSKGQILRLAAIFQALFQVWSPDEVAHYELVSPFNGSSTTVDDDVINEIKKISVSVMAMQSAISVVTLSLNQNLLLQGIEIAKFNTTLPFHEGGFFEEIENPIVTPSQTTSSSQSSRKRKRKTEEFTDAGTIMTSGGMLLDGKRINQYKKLGSKTNKQRIENAFVALEDASLGVREPNFQFRLRKDILEFIGQSEEARQFIADQRVSMPIFVHAMSLISSSNQSTNSSSSSGNLPGEDLLRSTNPIPSYVDAVQPKQVYMHPLDKLH